MVKGFFAVSATYLFSECRFFWSSRIARPASKSKLPLICLAFCLFYGGSTLYARQANHAAVAISHLLIYDLARYCSAKSELGGDAVFDGKIGILKVDGEAKNFFLLSGYFAQINQLGQFVRCEKDNKIFALDQKYTQGESVDEKTFQRYWAQLNGFGATRSNLGRINSELDESLGCITPLKWTRVENKEFTLLFMYDGAVEYLPVGRDCENWGNTGLSANYLVSSWFHWYFDDENHLILTPENGSYAVLFENFSDVNCTYVRPGKTGDKVLVIEKSYFDSKMRPGLTELLLPTENTELSLSESILKNQKTASFLETFLTTGECSL
jgi:hypothetical protein